MKVGIVARERISHPSILASKRQLARERNNLAAKTPVGTCFWLIGGGHQSRKKI
jgi:hypothetical protein